MEGVTLAFESKAPHTTPWLSVEHPRDESPEELIGQLAEIGWRPSIALAFSPPTDDGHVEQCVEPPDGSGPSGSWTQEEAKKYMPEVRRLLRRHGFDRVPWNRLDLTDLI